MASDSQFVFFISVDDAVTSEEQDAITRSLEAHSGVSVWHHLSHAWLVVAPTHDEMNSFTLRDQLKKLTKASLIVIGSKFDDVEIGAFVSKKAVPWLEEHLGENITQKLLA